MNTSTLTCIGFVQSLSKNYADAVDTFHKALGQKREDTFSSTMLTCVLEMCIEEPPLFNDYLDEESAVVESGEGKKSKKLDRTLKMNDDNDVILPFRNSKLRLWNRRLRKKTEDSSTTMEDDSTAMVIDSSSTADNSSFNMDLSTNMSENSNSFK
jgi:anaphase-promoting complex subunit 6